MPIPKILARPFSRSAVWGSLGRHLSPSGIADGWTVDRSFPLEDARRYGVREGITSDQTAAIDNALAASHAFKVEVVLPRGDIVGSIRPRSNTFVGIRGQGKIATRLISPTPGVPVVQMHPADDIAIVRGKIGHFSVSPNANVFHATNPDRGDNCAVDTAGFLGFDFEHIDYLDNGAAFFDSLFACSAIKRGTSNVYTPCYYNTIHRASIQAQSVGGISPEAALLSGVGIKYGVLCHNAESHNPAYNSNAIIIVKPFFYANNTLLFGVDALRSGAVSVETPGIEANPNAVAVRMGTATRVKGGWIEANRSGEEIMYDVGTGDGTSNGSTVEGTYMSSPGLVTIPSGTQDNIWVNTVDGKTFVVNALNSGRIKGVSFLDGGATVGRHMLGSGLTFRDDVATADSTWTKVRTMPNVQGAWLITANLGGSGIGYQISAVATCDGGGGYDLGKVKAGAGVDLRMNGADLEIKQTSGVPLTMNVKSLQVS